MKLLDSIKKLEKGVSNMNQKTLSTSTSSHFFPKENEEIPLTFKDFYRTVCMAKHGQSTKNGL